jgi:hypothetical protein
MKLKQTFASMILPLALALGGCATAYQPTGLEGGYEETQLAPDVYRVSFRGNAVTEPERAQDFALLRAAELTLQNGYTHFAVSSEQASTRHVMTRFGMLSRPRSGIMVHLLRGPAPGALEAKFLRNSMRTKYQLR